jgi:hypothetical protein
LQEINVNTSKSIIRVDNIRTKGFSCFEHVKWMNKNTFLKYIYDESAKERGRQREKKTKTILEGCNEGRYKISVP